LKSSNKKNIVVRYTQQRNNMATTGESKLWIAWRDLYWGEELGSFIMDSATPPRQYATWAGTFEIEVTGPDELTVKAGSLTHDGVTASWPEMVFHRGLATHPLHVSGSYTFNTTPGHAHSHNYYKSDDVSVYVVVLNSSGTMPPYDGENEVIFQIGGLQTVLDNTLSAPTNGDPNGSAVEGFIAAASAEAEGGASGDPFVTPMITA
jgi:hypothetical protein